MVEEADTATEVAEGTSKSEDTGEVEIQKKDENGVVAMEEDGKTETVKNDLKEEGKKKVEHIDSKDEEEKEEHIDSKEEKEKEEHKVEEENDNKAEGNKMDIDSKEVDENKVEIDNESKEVAESKGLKEEENKDSKEEEDINMEENKVSKKEEENKVEENKDLKEEENKVEENKDPREQEEIMDSKEEVENKNSKEEEETKDSKEEEENGIEEHNDLKAEEGNEREEPHDSKGNEEDEDTSNEENKKADAQVSGEGKRPRKRSYKGEAKEEGKEPTSPVASHIERPVRERKSVERLVASIEKEPAKEFLIPKGRGTALKDIPNVANKLSKKKNDENLKMLHVILFGRRGKASQVRSNISQFNGFVWHENEEKQRLKIKEKLDKLVKEKLLEFCDIFDIAVLKATAKKIDQNLVWLIPREIGQPSNGYSNCSLKEDIVTRLLDFLAAPKPASDVLVAEKEESGTTKKRSKVVKRGTPESGGSDAKHSSKKKRKTEGTLKVVENESESGDESDKSDTDGEFDKEDDEERAKNVSDGSEDEVAEHSKSKGKQNDFREESEEESRKQNPSLKGSSAKTTSGKSKPKKETTAKKENSVVSPKMYSTKKRSRDQAEKDEGIGRSGPDGSEDEAAEHSESKGNGNELCEESDEETRKENSVSGRLSAKMISPVEAKPKKKISTANETTVLSPAKSPSVKRFKVNDSSSKSIEVFSRKKKNQETDKAKSPAPLKFTKEIDVKEQSGKKTLKGKDERMKEKSAPTEPELRKVICQILTEVDLNKATFLDILKQLGDRFKMDLEPKKSDIKLMVKEELTKLNDEDDEDEDDESETEMEEQPKSAVRETKRPTADQGKSADPETRCRRSDGKKWRCSKAVVPGEKYCEHHMHRGRKR